MGRLPGPLDLITALAAPQVLDHVVLLCCGQIQLEERVVMVDHVQQRREATVVVEPALFVRPQSCQWRGAIHVGGRAIRLKRVDADLARGVQVVSGLREERRNMTRRAAGRPGTQGCFVGTGDFLLGDDSRQSRMQLSARRVCLRLRWPGFLISAARPAGRLTLRAVVVHVLSGTQTSGTHAGMRGSP